jgi:hypothetical protein
MNLEIITFPNGGDERQQLLTLFTICYLHFYKNFNYDDIFTYEDYFNQDLINLCTKYNTYIDDLRKFKIFCYSFCYQLLKEIKACNYGEIKLLYKYYNPNIIQTNQNDNINNNCPLQMFKNYVSKNIRELFNYDDVKFNLREMMNKKLMIPLVSTTERIVNMVMSVITFNTAGK